jgi:hypothetical protein
MRDDGNRNAIPGHLAEQAEREVVGVAVRELVHAVERQGARKHSVSARDWLTGSRHAVFRADGLPREPFYLVWIDEPGANGVENTVTCQPASWHWLMRAGRPSGAGAPLNTRYSTLRVLLSRMLPVPSVT